MRFMVLGKNDRTFVMKFLAQVRLEPDFFLHPDGHCLQKRGQAARRTGEIGREESLEFQKWFFIERDQIELGRVRQAGLAQAIIDRVSREAGVMFFPGETLLLRGRKDFAIAHEAGRAVVIKGRDAENVHGSWTMNRANSWAAIS